MKNFKKLSSFIVVVLTFSIALGSFNSPVLAYENNGANFSQIKTQTLSSTNGIILNKLNSVSKSTSALSQDLSNKKQNLSEPKKKLGTDLLKLIDSNFLLPNQNRIQLISEMKGLKQFVAKADSVQKIDKRVANKTHNDLVYVYVNLQPTTPTSVIDSIAWKVTDRDEKNHLAVALVDVNYLETLASLSGVKSISSVLPPVTNSGSVVTEGDIIHQTAAVRATYSQSGAGIKIGVISDGVDNIAIASSKSSGDLPAGVTVLSNSVGGDEGTAMLEIIYDMAPSASLYFHDRGSNVVAFNSAIDDLVSAGVNVIVDDVVWPGEPFFEDGTVASHVTSILATKNIIYVSAAGNYSEQHYQGDSYNDGFGFNDFSRGSGSTYQDKYLYVNIPPNGNVETILQWNDSFGHSGNDYDLKMFNTDGFGLLAVSDGPQTGTQDPLEAFSYTNTTGSTITAEIDVQNYNGLAATKTLELFIYPDNGTSVYSNNITPVDSVFGHAAVPGVIAVGAVNANNPTNIEPYSSQGPVTIIGQAQRMKPDVAGIDCVSTSAAIPITTGLHPFCGTSAAAPAVAAIVAQLWGQYPTATGIQIKNHILNSAVDLGATGTDMIYGHGRADSLLSFQAGPTITSFNFATPAVTGVVNEVTKTISLTVPFGTNLTALTPIISPTRGTVSPLSDVAQNFTTPQIYAVTASDGLVKSYTATVTATSNPAKAITAFTIPSQVGSTTIDENAHTIAVTMPYGTVVTALVPTFTFTGTSVAVGSTPQVSATTPNDFTSPVTYIVTAADASTQNYVVTVTVAPATTSTISGTIKYYDGVKVIPNVTVVLENNTGTQLDTTTTDANGVYQFTDVANGGNYVVRVSKSDNNSGLSSADQIKIGRHIVGLEPFNTIYKTISGDVNNSGGLTSADQIKIGRFIVGLDVNLPSGAWKFYSSDATLTTSNYLTEGLTRTYTNLTANSPNQGFIGVKMGDVNNSWVNN